MTEKRFAVFILSHGRAKTISTPDALINCGYTGEYFVVIDNEDDDEPLYREKFGDKIIQFDKRDYVKLTDLGDTDDDRRIGVLARNFIQDEAIKRGYRYHLQLDDDIHGFTYRYIKGDSLKAKTIRRMDDVFEAMCSYLDTTPITSLSFSLAVFMVGGINNDAFFKGLIPKTATTFLMRADDLNYFHMRMNDDMTTAAINRMRGKQYYTIMQLMLSVDGTQVQSGGMTEIYVDNGTYRKSFYSVMCIPSAVKITAMGITDYRIHHEFHWNNIAPKLLSESYRKV